MKFACLFVLLLHGLTLSRAQQCPMGTVRGLTPSDCYYYSATSDIWIRAEEKCIARGGHLASVSSLLLNSIVKDPARISCQDEYWLGGNWDQYQPNAWAWTDGKPFSFTNWAKGQPSTGGVLYVAMNVHTGQWYSKDGSQLKPFVCRVTPTGNATASPTENPPTTASNTCPTVSSPTLSPRPNCVAPPCCSDGWTYIPQAYSCFRVSTENTVWKIALENCHGMGGMLATIHSDKANTAILEFATSTYKSSCTWFAIGLFRPDSSDSFGWNDGSPLDYTNWGSNAPDVSERQCAFAEYCTGDRRHLQWTNDYCDDVSWPYVCQSWPIL